MDAPDGTRHTGRGEYPRRLGAQAPRHPGRLDRAGARRSPPGPPGPFDFYGTTLRVYDPGLDAWHILWMDGMKPLFRRQVGRASGADIVQEGDIDGGGKSRWRFTEITANSFHWLGERSVDGTSWKLLTEYYARRR